MAITSQSAPDISDLLHFGEFTRLEQLVDGFQELSDSARVRQSAELRRDHRVRGPPRALHFNHEVIRGPERALSTPNQPHGWLPFAWGLARFRPAWSREGQRHLTPAVLRDVLKSVKHHYADCGVFLRSVSGLTPRASANFSTTRRPGSWSPFRICETNDGEHFMRLASSERDIPCRSSCRFVFARKSSQITVLIPSIVREVLNV